MSEEIRFIGAPARTSRLVRYCESVTDNQTLSFFLAYWRSKRGGNILPLRENFLPQEIRGYLRWVVLADALPDLSDFRFRVVGTQVCRYILADGTGKTIQEALAGVDSGISRTTRWLYRAACADRAPIRLTGPSRRRKNIDLPDFDALYLPYSSDGEHADRVANILTFNHQRVLETLPVRMAAG